VAATQDEGGIIISGEGTTEGQGQPPIDVVVDLDLLDEAATRRVEQVVQKALEDELAKQPLPQGVGNRTITIGRISPDPI